MSRVKRDLLALFLLSLTVRLATAALILRPGYMDTAYYAAGAVRVAQGGGLTESFLWNYLDDPAGIPHPAFLYWMPFPSLLAAPFAMLSPGSFFTLQVPFGFLSALLPLVAFMLAWQITGRHRTAWLAGLLTLFSGFFFPYWTLPETFAPFALLGSLALWLAALGSREAGGQGRRSPFSCLLYLASGLLVGLAHLTRADGILLLPVILLASPASSRLHPTPHIARFTLYVSRLTSLILGYLLVMAPWFIRNLNVIGAPLPPAGTRTLWLTTYDDLFCYGCDLSLRSYLSWGWGNILRSKLWALGVNLERLLAEGCMVFLFPFVVLGLYRLRRHLVVLLFFTYSVLACLFHSLAFTFPGPRGGFFHASAAALPFLFVAAAEGLEAAVAWMARRRRWPSRQAQWVFATATVAGAIALSVSVAAEKLPAWQATDVVYPQIGEWLTQREGEPAIVMIANPPAFWYHTGYPAVVVPNGDPQTLLAVADRYGVRYVILDQNRPTPLARLYAGEESHPRLQPCGRWAGGEVAFCILGGGRSLEAQFGAFEIYRNPFSGREADG